MIKISTKIKHGWTGTKIVSEVQGLTDQRLGWFANDVVERAKKNAAKLPFEESTGALEQGIVFERLGQHRYKIETTSGHASWIEFGTQFIKGKMPFLWPAYRAVKRRFMRKKWI